MFHTGLALITASLLLLVRTTEEFVFDEVYDGEQLREILFSGSSGKTLRHAVLVLYTPDCDIQVNAWREKHLSMKLPDDFYVNFFIHDHETSKKFTWYKQRPSDDLTHWFNITENTADCPMTFFLPKGSSSQSKPMRLKNKKNFEEWLWNRVKVKVTLVNAAAEQVLFSFQGNHKNIAAVAVDPGQEKVVEAYTSYLVYATDEKNRFYGGWVLGFKSMTFKAQVATASLTKHQYISIKQEVMKQRRIKLGNEIWDISERHLLNRKQPLLLKNFTSTGYTKLKMPEWLKYQIHAFYRENRDYVEPEVWSDGITVINQVKQRCGMVHLDDAVKAVISAGLQPLLEEWSKIELEQTAFYGIREYYKGHFLKNHVDRIETHIISVILQVEQDLDGEADWELEVITFEGDRKYITLKPGDMLFYESARLIHGRPKIFQGKLMANAFLHYKPKDGWSFQRQNGHLIHHGQSLVKTYPLGDEFTEMLLNDMSQKLTLNVKDEL